MNAAEASEVLLSIVVPVYNEAESIDALLARLGAVGKDLGSNVRCELIFVDDGSRDATRSMLEQRLAQMEPWKLIAFSRNFGQQAAYRAGLEAASGDAVVCLDADLQDPPELIPEMLKLWQDGAKLVTGCRRSRPERGLKGLLLRLFHQIFFHATGGVMPKNSGTFGLLDRILVDKLCEMPELNLFLPALRCWIGFRQEIVWYDRAARPGEAKQTWGKLFNYAWDGITSFSVLPLKFISLLGLLISLGGLIYAAALIGEKFLQMFGFFQDLKVLGFTTLAVAVFCLGGIQLICLGVIGEYIARIYREVKRRPHFIIESVRESSPKPGIRQRKKTVRMQPAPATRR